MLAEVNYASLVTKCKLFLVAKGNVISILSGWFVKTCETIVCFTGDLFSEYILSIADYNRFSNLMEKSIKITNNSNN